MLVIKASGDGPSPHYQFECSSTPSMTLDPFEPTLRVVDGHDYDQQAPDLTVLSNLLLDGAMLCFFA